LLSHAFLFTSSSKIATPSTMNPRIIFILFITTILLASGFSAWRKFDDSATNKVKIGGDVVLTNAANNQPFDTQSLRGKFLLVYFGYSYCPDVCPTGLTRITDALKKLNPEKRAHLQPLFITIDPVRDTAKTLHDYMSNFDPSFIALTGSPEAIKKAADAYIIYFKSQQKNPEDKEYSVDHSSYIYVMNEEGDYISHFSHTTDPAIMAQKLAEILP
jgi:cytochrome oxidase Cu insertion factor (SCO1/SenC/PrrC family)